VVTAGNKAEGTRVWLRPRSRGSVGRGSEARAGPAQPNREQTRRIEVCWSRLPAPVRLPLIKRARALTLIEVLVLITVVGVITLFLLAAYTGARLKTSRSRCVSNLQSIGASYGMFSEEESNQTATATPPALPGSVSWATFLASRFNLPSNALIDPRVLVCPKDVRRPASSFYAVTASNVSYFISLDASRETPHRILAGDRNLTVDGVPVKPGLLVPSSNGLVGWSKAMHRGVGNVVLADGSVQQAGSTRGLSVGASTNRLVIP
jgi:type II secretory pathway pseudopilin PulG